MFQLFCLFPLPAENLDSKRSRDPMLELKLGKEMEEVDYFTDFGRAFCHRGGELVNWSCPTGHASLLVANCLDAFLTVLIIL